MVKHVFTLFYWRNDIFDIHGVYSDEESANKALKDCADLHTELHEDAYYIERMEVDKTYESGVL